MYEKQRTRVNVKVTGSQAPPGTLAREKAFSTQTGFPLQRGPQGPERLADLMSPSVGTNEMENE